MSMIQIAALIALVLIVGVVGWLIYRYTSGHTGPTSRGRMPRIAVLDEAFVDNQRRLVLVRRDNVEHLLLVGGKSDIIVETNIAASASVASHVSHEAVIHDHVPARIIPEDSDDIPRLDHPEPQTSDRLTYASLVDEIRRPAPERRTEVPAVVPQPPPRRDTRVESIAQRMPREPVGHPREREAPAARHDSTTKIPPLRVERGPQVAPMPTRIGGQQQNQTPEHNLVEMAQRLEAALRRPPGDGHAEPMPRPRMETAELASAGASRSNFESLEDEMASLLGRTKPSP
ncbi:MAG: flagellar biosynthetic protein FliO [Alphaproteobacteria bacterium]|nr:flagellar biosynthetic protein FliO [Alphaproteobacteria bacterium]